MEWALRHFVFRNLEQRYQEWSESGNVVAMTQIDDDDVHFSQCHPRHWPPHTTARRRWQMFVSVVCVYFIPLAL